MGCGSSNQVHQSNNPPPEENNNLIDRQQDDRYICNGRCYLFGQSSGEKKVVLFNSKKQTFTTISSRLRIPTPKVKLQPIQILYEESQEVILPDLMKKGPHPPFNNMFGTFCRKDVIFLCGGVNYQGEQVYSQSYFYNINPQTTKPKGSISPNNPVNNSRIYIKFERTASMSQKRYSHMGIYICERQFKSQYVYVFGGKNFRNESINTCEKFDLISKKWKEIAPMFTARSQGCAIRFMGNVYVFGGISNFRVYPQNIEVYNPKQDSWSMLNIQLHRGIRSCLVTSYKSNEIIIIGGISNIDKEQQNISSVIKVNLVQETYVWQGNFPQKISNIKYTYDSQGQKLTIFSNANNIIYSYQPQNKRWRNYGSGYKNYIPIADLYRFSCVAEPLDLKFDREEIKNNEIKQKQLLNSIKKEKNNKQFNLKDLFALGNQNYPCVINYNQTKTIFKQQIMKVSMKLQLRSKMNLCQTPLGYFITGGCDKNQRYSYTQSFLYNPKMIPYKAVQQLPTMAQGRHSAAIISVGEDVYIFGGIKNNGYALKSCQKFNIKLKRWENICNPMLKAVYNHIAYPLQFDQTKILLLGGQQFNGNPNTLLQIYDTSNKNTKKDVISYEQFSILKEGDIKQIFIRKLTQKQLQEVQINQQQYLLQTGHLYSQRQDIDKQPKIEQLKTGRSNHSMSPLGKIISSPKYKNLQLLHKSPQTKSTFKNLVIQNIPQSYRKKNLKLNPIPTPNPKNRVKTAQQQYLQKQQQQIRIQNHKIIKLKTQILSVKPKTSQQDRKKSIYQVKKQSKPQSPPAKKIQQEKYHINLNLMERQKIQNDDLKQQQLIQLDLDQDQFKNDHIKQEKQDSHTKKQQKQIQVKEQSEQMISVLENNQEQGVEFMTMNNINQKEEQKQQDSNIAFQKSTRNSQKIEVKRVRQKQNRQKNTKMEQILKQYQILRVFLYKQDKPQQKQSEIEKNIESNITQQNKNKQKQLKLNLKLQIKTNIQDDQNNREMSKSSRIADQKHDHHIDNVSKTSRLGNQNLENSNYYSVRSKISQSNISHSYLQQGSFNKITKVQTYNLLINKKTYQMHMIKNKKLQQSKKMIQNDHITLIPDHILYTHAFKSKQNNNHYFLNLLPNQSSLNNPQSDKLLSLYIVDSELIGTEISIQNEEWIKTVGIEIDDRLHQSGMAEYKVFTVPKQF